ncbi:epichloenin A synthetase [Epichloe bromicola]|uniref:Epichloenin A synthetase n=1 Tax=Epichloe bromicola TaxID=79588 RepID=A0ABQ0CNE5_9HYPO
MEKFTKGWVQHLRNTARQETPSRGYHCPLCEAKVQPNLDAFKTHVRADALNHPTMVEDSSIEEAFKKILLQGIDLDKPAISAAKSPQDTHISGATARNKTVSGNMDAADAAEDELDRLNLASDGTESSRRGGKNLCSPPASITQQRGSSPPTPGRSRARQSDSAHDFDRGLHQKNSTSRQLWIPDDDRRGNAAPQRPKTPQTRHGHLASSSTHRRSPQQKSHRRHQHHAQNQSFSDAASTSEMIRQPDTRPISSDQLVAEVKGIYAGLVLLESKCIEYDSSQQAADLSEEQYHALISLHRSLLHEHHDFFLASQHPSASEALRRLASKYAMPARMWRHGIHSFLELLRHKLPTSLEHMLTFIYIAYSIMALLYETVPAFKDTWIECLGDLGRYRMAIEDDDIRDREVWTGVSRYWYTKASDKAPTTGRLYHHLAILARPNALQQLYFYAKSLCVRVPFGSARDSVMTLFDPLLSPNSASNQRLEPVDAAFVRVHGILFSGKATDQLEPSMEQFLELLDSRIGRERGNWLESGYHVGISLSCLLLDFGNEANPLMRAISGRDGEGDGENDTPMSGSSEATAEPNSTFDTAISFAEQTYKIVIERWGDKNTLPCLHTTLVFYLFMTQRPAAMKHLEDKFPWKLTSVLLNYLLRTCDFALRIDTTDFPGPEKKEPPHPLPEDYAMRGLIYAEDYFPRNWFDNDKIDDDEKYFEPASTKDKRCERILWIGRMIARHGNWLLWDAATRQFTVTAKYDIEIHNVLVPTPPPLEPTMTSSETAVA